MKNYLYIILSTFSLIIASEVIIGGNDSSYRNIDGCPTKSCNASDSYSTALSIGYNKGVYQYNNNKMFVDVGGSFYMLPISNNINLKIFSLYTLQSYKLKNRLSAAFRIQNPGNFWRIKK